MMANPVSIDLTKTELDTLRTIYKRAYVNIAKELNGATSFGVYNRLAILAQVQNILRNLGIETNELISVVIPKYYQQGLRDAASQIAEADISFNLIHQEALQALITDTNDLFQNSIDQTYKNIRTIINKMTQEELTAALAESMIGGRTLKQTTTMIKKILLNSGLTSFKDRAGRTWQLDRYAEMLIRTKVVEARNRALINKTVETGNDLVQVTDHVNECALCRPWEGKILSLTGKTRGYPTLAQAQSEGLFHPNCRHAVNVYNPIFEKPI